MREEAVGLTVPRAVRHVTIWAGAVALSALAWVAVLRVFAAFTD
jgi:hypothetical protein